MKRIAFLIFSLLFQFGAVQSQEQTGSKLDWNQVGAAWSQFLSNPTEAHGSKLYSLIPNKHYRKSEADSIYREAWDSLYENLYRLRALVKAQRRIAVQIAFKLYSISDGDFAETIDQMLGGLIRTNPSMFLEELKAHRDLAGDLGGLVGNLGEDLVDKTQAQNSEIKLRIRALKTVRASVLLAIRNECIAELTSQLR